MDLCKFLVKGVCTYDINGDLAERNRLQQDIEQLRIRASNDAYTAKEAIEFAEQYKAERDRYKANLEWLVYWCLRSDDPPISIGRGKELLGFTDMMQMREWMNKKAQEADREKI